MLSQELRTLTTDFKEKAVVNPFHGLEQKLREIANSGGRYHYINNIFDVKGNPKSPEADNEIKKWQKWAETNGLNLKIKDNWGGFENPEVTYWSATITW